MTAKPSETIWTRPFVLLCLAEFLSYGHNSLLTPMLPLYVTHLGGTPFLVGVLLAVFCATSVLLRPKIGYWADNWSYAGILSVGSLLLGLSVLLYLVPAATALIVSNGLRGIGWAGLNTGGYSLLARSAPDKRRGEASGYYSSFQSCAHVLFPALALWMLEQRWGGFHSVIFLSAALALIGGGIGWILKPMSEQPAMGSRSAPSTSQPQAGISSLVDKNVLLAAGLLLCMYLSMPATTSFIVLHAKASGITGLGWYFVAGGLTHVLGRPIFGRLSDRIGRRRSIATAFTLEVFGLFLMLIAPNLSTIVLGGVLYAVGTALGTSTTMAMAITAADPQRRGVAMATFSTAYPLSVGLGAILSGTVVDVAGFTWMFITAMMTGALGLTVTIFYWSSLDRITSEA